MDRSTDLDRELRDLYAERALTETEEMDPSMPGSFDLVIPYTDGIVNEIEEDDHE